MFTAKIGGRSLYGHIDRFISVRCHFSGKCIEFAKVSWFARPVYPDRDPLTVDISLRGTPVPAPPLLYLDEIDPARICYYIDTGRERMSVMRIEGVDVSPEL